MNRQQAPQPVVSPLVKVRSENDLATLLSNQPIEGGAKTLCAAIKGYAVVFEVFQNSMSAYVMVCNEMSSGYKIAETDSVDVITPLVDLPCSTNVVEEDTINEALQELVENVANYGGYEFANYNIYEREDYSTVSLTCKLL